MNVNVFFNFMDESPYNVCLNIIELAKQSEELKTLCEVIETAIAKKSDAIPVTYDHICSIWDGWDAPGVRVILPAAVHAEIALNEI
jgi:hypothetical protein